MKRTILAAAILAALSGSSQARAAMPEAINFGVVSTESSQALKDRYLPFMRDMEKALGIPVKPFFAPDYAGIIEGMRFGKVDVAYFGAKAAIEAVDRAGAEVFAQTNDDSGNPGYWSVMLVHQDSPINTIDDALKCDRSLTFGNGDPNSTSGFLVPSYYVFAQRKIDPKTCFKAVRAANHEANAMAVAHKQVDLATNNSGAVERLRARHPEEAAKLREIWRSPLIPSNPFAWRKALDEDAKQRIFYFFLRYGRSGEPEKIARELGVLAEMSPGWTPFLASSDAQLLPVRQLELFRERMKAEAAEGLDAKEKAEKIARIDARLRDLDALTRAVVPASAKP